MTNDERLRSGDPVLFASDACLIVRRPGMVCGVCRDACPVGVLSGTQWWIALQEEGCLGCGICAASCPTGALSVEGFALKAPGATGERILIECRRVVSADLDPDAIVVPCLGGLTTPDLLQLVAHSDAPVALVDRGWCAACPVGQCADPWRATIDETKSLLRALDEGAADGLIVETRTLPASQPQPIVPALRPDQQVGRREFLRRLVGPAVPPDPLAESRRVVFGRGLVRPVKRARIRGLVAALAEEIGCDFPGALMPAIKIADSCELSGVCAAVCPTGALHLDEVGDAMSLNFDAVNCIACGECQRVCPSKALTLWPDGDGTLEPQGPVELVAKRCRACIGCGGLFLINGAEDDTGQFCGFCQRSIGVMRDISAFRSKRPEAG